MLIVYMKIMNSWQLLTQIRQITCVLIKIKKKETEKKPKWEKMKSMSLIPHRFTLKIHMKARFRQTLTARFE